MSHCKYCGSKEYSDGSYWKRCEHSPTGKHVHISDKNDDDDDDEKKDSGGGGELILLIIVALFSFLIIPLFNAIKGWATRQGCSSWVAIVIALIGTLGVLGGIGLALYLMFVVK